MDGDLIMQEGGECAPTPSNVAAKLAKQHLDKKYSENTDAFKERIVNEALADHQEKLAQRKARAFKRAEEGKGNQGHTGAGEVKSKDPEGVLAGFDPATAVVVVAKHGEEASSKQAAEGVGEHGGGPREKDKRKRGKRKRGRGGQGAKGVPDERPAGSVVVRDHPPKESRGEGNHRVPNPGLTFPSLERRFKLTWSRGWPLSTEPNLRGGTDNSNKPPGAARLGGTPGSPPMTALWATDDVSVRPPLSIADLRLTTQSFWALSLAHSSSSRSAFSASEKGIRIPLS
jgi:hypothetical protein